MTIDFGPYFSTPGIGVFRGCSCLRQSQAVAKKQESFCWPCFPYYLFLLAFLFPKKQPELPSPTFLVLLPFPAFLVLLALSSHSSQTNNQTNNQRNKQTHKQETNTQTSAPRCSQKLTGAPRNPRYFQIIRDASRCYQVLPDARRCSKVLPDTPRCSKMLPQTPRYSQIHPDAPRYSQMLRNKQVNTFFYCSRSFWGLFLSVLACFSVVLDRFWRRSGAFSASFWIQTGQKRVLRASREFGGRGEAKLHAYRSNSCEYASNSARKRG